MDKKDIKKYVIIDVIVLIVVLGIVLFFVFNNNKETTISDAMKFKTEYEALNGEKASGDNIYQTLEISEDNKIEYTDLKGAVEFLKNGTGLIYFGFPNCPWCRGMLPSLLEVVEDSRLEKILYVDMTGQRDTYEVKDKKAVKTKDASEEYYEILEILDDYLSIYTVTAQDGEEIAYETGEKRVYVPLVVAVKDGVVKDAVTSPVKLDKNQTAYDVLTLKQKEDLEELFKDMIDKTRDAVCDEHC